jgi:hypothetical protein
VEDAERIVGFTATTRFGKSHTLITDLVDKFIAGAKAKGVADWLGKCSLGLSRQLKAPLRKDTRSSRTGVRAKFLSAVLTDRGSIPARIPQKRGKYAGGNFRGIGPVPQGKPCLSPKNIFPAEQC